MNLLLRQAQAIFVETRHFLIRLPVFLIAQSVYIHNPPCHSFQDNRRDHRDKQKTKAVVVKAFDDGTKARSFGHALVAGVDRAPLKVIKTLSPSSAL